MCKVVNWLANMIIRVVWTIRERHDSLAPAIIFGPKMFGGGPEKYTRGMVKIKVLCDLLICSTLITWDWIFRQVQWASCDGTWKNINEFLDHLRSSTPSSAIDPHMMGTSKLMSTSITWGQALRRAQRTLAWWCTLWRTLGSLEIKYSVEYNGLSNDQAQIVIDWAPWTNLRSSTPSSTTDSLVVGYFV